MRVEEPSALIVYVDLPFFYFIHHACIHFQQLIPPQLNKQAFQNILPSSLTTAIDMASDEATTSAPIEMLFTSLGTITLDEIHLPSGEIWRDVIGGTGVYGRPLPISFTHHEEGLDVSDKLASQSRSAIILPPPVCQTSRLYHPQRRQFPTREAGGA